MIPLAIWLVLIGYSVTWTGRQNMSLSYRPQADGSIQAVDSTGKQAQTWTLLDAVTCGPASGAAPGASGPPTTSPGPGPGPGLRLPNLAGNLLPGLNPSSLPNVQLPRIGLPHPAPLPGIGGLVDEVAHGVHDVLLPIVRGIESLHVPRPGFLPHLGGAMQ